MTTNNHTAIASNASGTPATFNSPLGELDAAIGVNTVSASAPTVNDDETDGYRVGNTWYDSSTGLIYVVTDVTTGSADWEVISTSASNEWDELTISTGAVTLTDNTTYTIDTEGGAGNDNLDSINNPVDAKIIYLRAENSARRVTLTETGNMSMPEGMGSMELSTDRIVMLIYDDDYSKWFVNQPQHGLKLPETGEYTISSGAITIIPGAGVVDVDTESDAAADDLATINGGFPGMMVTLRLENAARIVTLKDGTGNLNLGGSDLEFAPTRDHLVTLWYDPGATEWVLHSTNIRYREEYFQQAFTPGNTVTIGSPSVRYGRVRESSAGEENPIYFYYPAGWVATNELVIVFVSTGVAVDWRADYGYGQIGESHLNTSGSNQSLTTTTAGTSGDLDEEDISSFFSGATAGDSCWINPEGTGAGSTEDIGIRGVRHSFWERV